MQVQANQTPQWQALKNAQKLHAPARRSAHEPKDEVFIQSYEASIHTPMELTPLAYALPRPADRIDSIKEVLTVQDAWNMGITGKGVTVAVIDTLSGSPPGLGIARSSSRISAVPKTASRTPTTTTATAVTARAWWPATAPRPAASSRARLTKPTSWA